MAMSVTSEEIAKEINLCEGTFPQYQENPWGEQHVPQASSENHTSLTAT